MRDEFFTPTKYTSVTTSLLLCLALTGCGSDSDDSETSSSASSSTTTSSSSSVSSSVSSSSVAAWPGINIEGAAAKTLRIHWDAVENAAFYRVYKDPDGNSGYTQVGADTTAPELFDTVSVHLHDWANARYMVEACVSANDCTNSDQSIAINAMADSIGYAKASNTEAGDWFGWDVALSADGMTLAVSATQEDSVSRGINGDQNNDNNVSTGAVYVFNLSDAGWSQQAYIKASNTEQQRSLEDDSGNQLDFYITQDRFGYSIDLSDDGNTLAVSAIREDSNARGINGEQDNNSATDAGAVYLFERSQATWVQSAYIKASNTPEEESSSSSSESSASNTSSSSSSEYSDTTGDRFGNAVKLSGDGTTLAVAALYEASALGGINGDESDNTLPQAGAVYVFSKTDGNWTQQAFVKAETPVAGDRFGSSIALSQAGDVLAVGAIGEDSAATGINQEPPEDTIASSSGAVYVFRRSDTTWAQEAYLKSTFTYTSQFLGSALAISADGNTLAAAAPGDGSRATGIDGDPEDYAELVDLSDGETQPDTAYKSGAVHVFSYQGDSWSQTAYLKASHPDAYDEFGHDLAMTADGQYLAVSAHLEDSQATGIEGDAADNSVTNSGAVYLFKRTDTSWQQARYIKGKTAESNDRWGDSLAMDGISATLAIASIREDSAATGVDGDAADNSAPDSGAVLLY
ncbi:FG-GAP repeat protein [Gilvimarinus sp. 1_MG-2023]|uniref:FG-GAP repeat protein n=1 Tax=Gilvimarinus sp. 1_MG-2023 TaxID=3062638 RepID=UPI0026E47E1A|nr:FG-GAP repeat protein [Gilvimarinus sp. 1_MG-2023]MDO6747450.1 hypothetical protein [Gilvimarinus sp. 1_MG-2023]